MLSDTQIGEIFQAKKEEWRTMLGPVFSVLFARAIESAVRAEYAALQPKEPSNG